MRFFIFLLFFLIPYSLFASFSDPGGCLKEKTKEGWVFYSPTVTQNEKLLSFQIIGDAASFLKPIYERAQGIGFPKPDFICWGKTCEFQLEPGGNVKKATTSPQTGKIEQTIITRCIRQESVVYRLYFDTYSIADTIFDFVGMHERGPHMNGATQCFHTPPAPRGDGGDNYCWFDFDQNGKAVTNPSSN